MTEIGMYAFKVSTDECFSDLCKGAKKMDALREKANLRFVYQDPKGMYQAFLFKSEEERDKALKAAIETGFKTAKKMKETCYVDSRYLKQETAV